MSGANSQREHKVVLVKESLVAEVKAVVPRETSIRRVLRSGPVEPGLEVAKWACIDQSPSCQGPYPGSVVKTLVTQFGVIKVGHLARIRIVIAPDGTTEGKIAARSAGIGGDGQPPVVVAQVVGGVHGGYPKLSSLPGHGSVQRDAVYSKGFGGGQIAIRQPDDVKVGVVYRLATEGADQRSIGASSCKDADVEERSSQDGSNVKLHCFLQLRVVVFLLHLASTGVSNTQFIGLCHNFNCRK
ncbi:hypothetical protein [Candidatus Nitrotoga sp. 1052]|uniref:hypothetical protein n=1 Tax=Candidatus Nitrotoga sp. 1052 TaxID=2886964 RepID=UPI001EF51E60|nr:hypothetical protein [Candidatus Nitrotoga sp. 1052]